MFKVVLCEDVVRIPPDKFGNPLKQVALEQLKAKYEGTIDDVLGFIILVMDVNVESKGKIIHGDGATYHRATFKILSFIPELHEVVEGEVVEIQSFGAFVRIGPVDALLHISQIMDDLISFDEKSSTLRGRKTQRTLSKGDKVRARIVAVSLARGETSGMTKIGLTARQPFLGKLEWIDEDVRKLKAKIAAGVKK